jgi:hypothetical protein
MSVSSWVTMPLALDLTSTWVMGQTLPVATTERAMSPVSTVPICEGSSGGEAVSVCTAKAPPAMTTSAPMER